VKKRIEQPWTLPFAVFMTLLFCVFASLYVRERRRPIPITEKEIPIQKEADLLLEELGKVENVVLSGVQMVGLSTGENGQMNRLRFLSSYCYQPGAIQPEEPCLVAIRFLGKWMADYPGRLRFTGILDSEDLANEKVLSAPGGRFGFGALRAAYLARIITREFKRDEETVEVVSLGRVDTLDELTREGLPSRRVEIEFTRL
jgi:hypothetical protein